MFKVDNKTLVHDAKYVKKVKKLTIHAHEQSHLTLSECYYC